MSDDSKNIFDILLDKEVGHKEDDHGRHALTISIYPDCLEKLDELGLLIKFRDTTVRVTRSSVVSSCINSIYSQLKRENKLPSQNKWQTNFPPKDE